MDSVQSQASGLATSSPCDRESFGEEERDWQDIPQKKARKIEGKLVAIRDQCHAFIAHQGDRLFIQTEGELTLISPQQSLISVGQTRTLPLTESGIYQVRAKSSDNYTPWDTFSIRIDAPELQTRGAHSVTYHPIQEYLTSPIQSAIAEISTLTTVDAAIQLTYNVKFPPPFSDSINLSRSPSLDTLVKGSLALLKDQGYPTENVSISLVDLTEDCCDYAAYQDTIARYPASVVKLFWIVALYGHYEAGILQPGVEVVPDDEELMIQYSNNGASSRIVDAISQTESGEDLTGEDLEAWIKARKSLNTYFRAANYPDLNIAHKTFPIPDLELTDRSGRDLQFAMGESGTIHTAENGQKALLSRNMLTTLATARLLYEIDTGQAISPEASDRIKQYLRHSTDPGIWQYEEVNAIEDFFGEYLPPTTQLYTKLGYTFDDGRQEAAIIASEDGSTRFILVVFANDPIYSQEGTKAFPEIARYVYEQMQLRSQNGQTSLN